MSDAVTMNTAQAVPEQQSQNATAISAQHEHAGRLAEFEKVRNALKAKHGLALTIQRKNNKAMVTNSDSILIVLNKGRYLPEDYVPIDLVEVPVPFASQEKSDKRFMRKEAAMALAAMFAQAEKEGIQLAAVSGYRSYQRQQEIYQYFVRVYGKAYAKRISARPGTSEHQTGLSMDIASAASKKPLKQAFGKTREGLWVAKNMHKFGFIQRYPEGREALTGYMYEPWHLRFVGKEVAALIFEQKLTLEELLG